jgi:hypothetical protein
VTNLRAYGPVLVATIWLVMLIQGVSLIPATAIVMPPFFLALQGYLRELQERMHHGNPRHRR